MSKKDWWREAIIYQIYPRSLKDASGDGVGDLSGIIDSLSAIRSLGVNTLWISPFFQSPMKDFGYDVSDHCEVDPLFGTLQDAKELVDRAHSLGFKVLVDLVISHTSDQHPWFEESRSSRDHRKSDYYVWADAKPDGTPPNNWLSIFGGSAWQWDTRRCQYYLHHFLTSQPDLNFHHPEVQTEVLKVADHWMNIGVDGFRLDTVNFYFHDRQLRDNPPALVRDQMSAHETNPYGWQEHRFDKNQPEVIGFLKRLRERLDHFGDRIGLGEIGESPTHSLDLLITYTAPDRLQLCYSFDLLSHLGDAPYWRGVIDRFEHKVKQSAVDSWPCWAFSNHDVQRAATRLCPDGGSNERTGMLLMALLLSLRGTPCLYQGEELALPEVEVPFESLVDPYGIEFWPTYKGRDGCRTPYPWSDGIGGGFSEVEPWLPMTEAHRNRAFSLQDHDPNSPLSITRRLIAMRQDQAALTRGDIKILEGEPQILAFERSMTVAKEEKSVITCLFNPTVREYCWSVVEPLGEALECSDPELKAQEGEKTIRLPSQSWAFFKRAVQSSS